MSSWRLRLKLISFVLLTLFFLPISTSILIFNYARFSLSAVETSRRRIRRRHSFQPKTVLITGVGTTKGLVLARSFYEAGHYVIGADFEPHRMSVNGRFSRSLERFYSLADFKVKDGFANYLRHLIRIIQREKVDLWINCTEVTSAVDDARAKEIIGRRSNCIAIQYDVATTSALHDVRTFIQCARKFGLPALETHEVTSRAAVHKILHSPAASDKHYIIKSTNNAHQGAKTIIPRGTISETYDHISSIPISNSNPWILQEQIRGQQYSTHALIISNVVKTFVACPSTGQMHLPNYEVIPPRSPLSLAMLHYTQEFARQNPPGMTGHLNFEFMVQERVSEKGLKLALRVFACSSRANKTVALYATRSQGLANAYLSALRPSCLNGNSIEKQHLLDPEDLSEAGEPELEADTSQSVLTPPECPPKYNWMAFDIATLQLWPYSISVALYSIISLLQHLFFWKDPIFVSWDPLPWWWFHQVYLPGIFLMSIWAGRVLGHDEH